MNFFFEPRRLYGALTLTCQHGGYYLRQPAPMDGAARPGIPAIGPRARSIAGAEAHRSQLNHWLHGQFLANEIGQHRPHIDHATQATRRLSGR